MSLRERMKHVGISMFSLPFLLRDIQAAYKEEIKTILPISGMDKLVLELAKAGYPLAIITSNREQIVKQFVQANDMDVFSAIHGERNIFGKGKVIRQFLADHSLTVNDAIYIGDELRDIEACHQVGIPIYAVAWGFDPEPLLQSGNPTRLFHSPKALWEAILSDSKEKP
jgi:phosphoglycolate phosphatase